MSDATTSLVILGCVVALFVWNRLPVGAVAVLAGLSLYATGLLSAEEAIAGFGDPVVVFIAALFVVSEGIDAAGVTTWVGQQLLARIGDKPRTALTLVMLLAAVMSALITLNGAAAALLPMVVVIALKLGVAPARMLMPMAFAGSSGSLLVLTASPINVLVSDASDAAGAGGFSFLEFAIIGIPLVGATALTCLMLGDRVIPDRSSRQVPPDLSGYAVTLAEQYDLTDGFYRLRVREHSPLVGVPADSLDLTDHPGLVLLGVQRGAWPCPVGDTLRTDDVLSITGPSAEVSHLAQTKVLAVAMRPVTRDSGELITREMGVAELVVPPQSPLVGETVFPGQARGPEIVILGVRRLGEERGARSTELHEGDSLLVQGSWEAVQALTEDRDVLVVNSPDLVRRQTAPLDFRAWRSISVLGAMIVVLALGLMPPATAGLAAAVAMVLLKVISSAQGYRAVSWQTVVLIGGLIPLSTAIQESGAADQISDVLLRVVGDAPPVVLALAVFVLTAALGQFISNTATVLILLPVVVTAAESAGVSPQPLLMTLAVAGSASFLTPVATPANMMVMGPAGYRFGDYWRLGLPMLGVWLLLCLTIVPLVWPF